MSRLIILLQTLLIVTLFAVLAVQLYWDQREIAVPPAQRQYGESRQRITTPDSYVIFDATLFKDKPDLSKFGIHRLQVIYQNQLWASGKAGEKPDEYRVREIARQLAGKDRLVCLDIEHWELRTGSQVQIEHNLLKLMNIIDWMHAENPGLRLGYYRLIPQAEYWAPVTGNHRSLQNWYAANRFRQPLAERVDVLFPAVYTFTDDPDKWEIFAKANIAQARKYGKAIYPFIWPKYHQAAPSHLRGKWVSPEMWRRQLEVCRDHADGVVIWGGHNENWDPQSSWWQITRQFMDEMGYNRYPILKRP